MYEKLKEISIELKNEEIELFDKFNEFFLKYNENINLVSRKDSIYLFEKHIYDSLAINLFLERYKIKKNCSLMDMGTGGGFPSIPCSLYYKDMQVTAIDSIRKKINFIKTVKKEFSINNINPICSRVEELSFKYKNNFDIVITRAMAELRIILEYAIPYIKVGGYFIAYKSIKADEEIINAQNDLKKLNAKVIDKIGYELPIEDENKRVLLIIKKEKETPSIYPRKNGLVKKNPL